MAERRYQSRQQRRPAQGSGRRPHFRHDPDVEEKLNELEASGEPLSLAETLSIEEAKANEGHEVSKQDVINVAELQKMSVSDLKEQAEAEGAELRAGMQNVTSSWRFSKLE